MELLRWRCETCGFHWFEECQVTKNCSNINHGCPQGCDDAGKVIGSVEATDHKGEWICWILSKEEIDDAAKRLNKNVKSLTDINYQEMAGQFKKGLMWSVQDWDLILETAVEKILR